MSDTPRPTADLSDLGILDRSGLVIVDKPSGLTSHDVVGRCRRLFGTRR
ncbi:MAG TPA: tRNA pseudouridine(55) synthase TruB, partial [Corynebacterium nuruki]|nr:tRNA pseudouridine(55) synthase TruB [Corynebacterium nuruki]